MLLDSGLQAEVSEDGVKFSELNDGRSMLAWHSCPIGEIKFAELDQGSVGEYGQITGHNSVTSEVTISYRTTPDQVMPALPNALGSAEGLSKTDQAKADDMLATLSPLVDISAHGTEQDRAEIRGMTFGGIQGDLNGEIELDYMLNPNSGTQTEVSLEGDQLNFQTTHVYEYFTG